MVAVGHEAVGWLAVYTSPQQEDRAEDCLIRRFGLSVVCPRCLIRVRSRTRGRRLSWTDRVVPYYPRYIFSRIPYQLLQRVRDLASVSTIVSCDGAPVVVSDEVVEGVRALDGSERYAPEYSVGDEVTLTALAGLRAIVTSVDRLRDHSEVTVEARFFGGIREMPMKIGAMSKSDSGLGRAQG